MWVSGESDSPSVPQFCFVLFFSNKIDIIIEPNSHRSFEGLNEMKYMKDSTVPSTRHWLGKWWE